MKSMMMPMLILLVLVIASLTFVWQGIGMQSQVAIEEAKFHALQQDYFIMSKVEREAAVTGSELNQKLVQIQNYPSELLRLKLVGAGKILTGIFLSLLAIVFLLFMVPIRLAKLMKENRQ
ncbi:MAG: hypothetical protein HY458_02085 [Parcubacteria group bacterium]|nr:hypothetical protein [Parcubacteria group bacterium]